jgi:hypothetical protein
VEEQLTAKPAVRARRGGFQIENFRFERKGEPFIFNLKFPI